MSLRALEPIVEANLIRAAAVLGVAPTKEAIQAGLRERIPDIDTGRKTSQHLLNELALGECQLEIDATTGELVRHTFIVSVQISHNGLKLIEAYQEWFKRHDNKIENRNLDGVTEKIQRAKEDESYLHLVAKRAVREELGRVEYGEPDFEVAIASLDYLHPEDSPNPVSNYRGIKSYGTKYFFQATITPESFRDEYSEIQPEKRTVFKWVKAE